MVKLSTSVSEAGAYQGSRGADENGENHGDQGNDGCGVFSSMKREHHGISAL